MLVLTVVLVPTAYLIDSTVQQTASAKDRVTATELAEEELENLNNASLTSLESNLNQSQTAFTSTVSGVTYTVKSYLAWEGSGSAPDLCTSGSPPQSLSATATVSWGAGPVLNVAEQSIIDPPYNQPTFQLASALNSGSKYTSISAVTSQSLPVGAQLTIGAGSSVDQTVTVSANTSSTTIPVNSFTANSAYAVNTQVALPSMGYLGIQIDGVSGSAPAGVTSNVSVQVYSVSSQTTSTYTPDGNGCVYQEEVPGTYYVTLSSSTTPGYVDVYENPSPTTQGTNPYVVGGDSVTAGAATIWTVNYNQGGFVTFSPSGSLGVATGVPVSVANSGIPNSPTTVVPAGSSANLVPLYPFASSYSAWYGDCAAEQPTSPATFSVTVGGSTQVGITGLVALTIQPQTSAGASDPGATITATLADPTASTDGCSNPDVFSMPASTSSSPSQAGVVQMTTTDSATTKSGSSTITDSAIQAGDLGRLVTGPGIPANSYVGTVTAGNSFVLSSSPSTSTAVNATATASTSIVISGDVYSVTVKGSDNKTTTATIYVTSVSTYCKSGCTSASVVNTGTAESIKA